VGATTGVTSSDFRRPAAKTPEHRNLLQDTAGHEKGLMPSMAAEGNTSLSGNGCECKASATTMAKTQTRTAEGHMPLAITTRSRTKIKRMTAVQHRTGR
jgi:hypothetical protein